MAGRSPLPWLFERADAVLATWFLGSEAGHAIADVLTGALEPERQAGRDLAATTSARSRSIYARRSTGRPANPEVYFSARHIDLPIEPQFPLRPRPVLHALRGDEALRATPAEITAGEHR